MGNLTYNYCKKCSKKISSKSKYCQYCYLHFFNPAKIDKIRVLLSHKKEKHPLWKGGLPKCLDCGKQLSRYKAKRCRKCAKQGKLHSLYGKKMSKETRLKKSISMKIKFLDKDFKNRIVKKFFERQKFHQNKQEKILENIINEILPNEYKFVGDGKIFIENFVPDFININGQKKIIEFFGSYWHKRKETANRDIERLKIYKKYGYETLIVWDYELKDIDCLKNKILSFNRKEICQEI